MRFGLRITPQTLRERIENTIDAVIPEELKQLPEWQRQARILSGFALLGLIFGSIFACVYFLIGHHLGAMVVVVCTLLLTSSLLLWKTGRIASHRRLRRVGHFQAAILHLGFLTLTLLEGGLRGHAAAWLASAPLVALLILGRTCWPWFVFSLVSLAGIAVFESRYGALPSTYPSQSAEIVTILGVGALAPFLFCLGALFEQARHRAQERAETSLRDLQVANQRLSELNHMKSEFMGIAAHDLRNPLAVVSLMAETWLLNPPGQKQTEETFARIKEKSQQMNELIIQFLDSHAKGHQPDEHSRIDLADLTYSVAEDYSMQIEKKDQFLVMTGEQPGEIICEPMTLRLIVENLISNAVKYTPRKGTITISWEIDATGWQWTISDSGPGISKEDQAKLFQKYTRLSARPTGDEDSVGLGLANAKGMADRLGLRLAYLDISGQGAVFQVQSESEAWVG